MAFNDDVDRFFHACRFGDIKTIDSCLQRLSIDVRDKYGKTGLMRAAGQGQTPAVCHLLEKGAGVNYKCYHGVTALAWSRLSCAQPLLRAGATIPYNWRDKKGRSDVDLAVYFGDLEKLKLMSAFMKADIIKDLENVLKFTYDMTLDTTTFDNIKGICRHLLRPGTYESVQEVIHLVDSLTSGGFMNQFGSAELHEDDIEKILPYIELHKVAELKKIIVFFKEERAKENTKMTSDHETKVLTDVTRLILNGLYQAICRAVGTPRSLKHQARMRVRGLIEKKSPLELDIPRDLISYTQYEESNGVVSTVIGPQGGILETHNVKVTFASLEKETKFTLTSTTHPEAVERVKNHFTRYMLHLLPFKFTISSMLDNQTFLNPASVEVNVDSILQQLDELEFDVQNGSWFVLHLDRNGHATNITDESSVRLTGSTLVYQSTHFSDHVIGWYSSWIPNPIKYLISLLFGKSFQGKLFPVVLDKGPAGVIVKLVCHVMEAVCRGRVSHVCDDEDPRTLLDGSRLRFDLQKKEGTDVERLKQSNEVVAEERVCKNTGMAIEVPLTPADITEKYDSLVPMSVQIIYPCGTETTVMQLAIEIPHQCAETEVTCQDMTAKAEGLHNRGLVAEVPNSYQQLYDGVGKLLDKHLLTNPPHVTLRILPHGYVNVAVLCSGVFDQHQVFIHQRQRIITRDYVNNSNTDPIGRDLCNHGTAIAAMIGGGVYHVDKVDSKGFEYRGLAPFARLIILKVVDKDGNINPKHVIRALQDLGEFDEQGIPIDIVNISFGLSHIYLPADSKEIEQLISAASLERVVVCPAASNGVNGCDTVTYPAKFRNNICVGSHDANGIESKQYGAGEVDFHAPGKQVPCPSSRSPSDTYLVEKRDGTSYSAAYVTGVAAQVLAMANLLGDDSALGAGKDLRKNLTNSVNMRRFLPNILTQASCTYELWSVYEQNGPDHIVQLMKEACDAL